MVIFIILLFYQTFYPTKLTLIIKLFKEQKLKKCFIGEVELYQTTT